MHVPGRNHSEQRSTTPDSERDVKWPGIIRFAKSMEARLHLAMLGIFQYQKRLVKENFLRFRLAHSMFLRIFTRIAFIPLKASNTFPIDHGSYITNIYISRKFLLPRQPQIIRHARLG